MIRSQDQELARNTLYAVFARCVLYALCGKWAALFVCDMVYANRIIRTNDLVCREYRSYYATYHFEQLLLELVDLQLNTFVQFQMLNSVDRKDHLIFLLLNSINYFDAEY